MCRPAGAPLAAERYARYVKWVRSRVAYNEVGPPVAPHFLVQVQPAPGAWKAAAANATAARLFVVDNAISNGEPVAPQGQFKALAQLDSAARALGAIWRGPGPGRCARAA